MISVKSAVVGIISFLAVVGFSTPETTYAWVGDQTFSNIGNIYMPGYTIPSGIGSYQGMSYGMPQQGGNWGWKSSTYPARAFNPLTDTFPVYQQQSYGMGHSGGYTGYGYSSYGSYPQMMYDPYFGYSAAFGPAYPTGDYDLVGQPLCQWYDYNGHTPCNYDPHQWIYDPYTGTWY